ncbi:addiction module antidote protein [Actinobacillus equuli]|uniref:addiction module antidote protein n=1 Tax=Actinobacillus equuli TaxID=718 RepID=UPI002442A915|nr:addiction module antidote protein [Actinobacillus equuli]WGE64967.1 putative addiction module antidote protein [Actinobacillus equuli subsp. equuli]WGE78949.1 putative addiction module antidote protein [Actinobacillus equuli subsp. equuli]
MDGNTKTSIETTPFDLAEYLDSEEAIQIYLTQVLADGDNAEFLRALGHIARARSMSELAQKTGLGRESLYKTLSANSKPRFETILKILKALNIELVPVIKTL